MNSRCFPLTLPTAFAALAVLLASSAGAQPAVPDGAIAADTMREVTRILSSDAFEGRAPGTAGEEKTVALLTERFRAAGLSPGNGDSWEQEVPLVSIDARQVTPLAVTGGLQPLSLAFRTDMVVGSYRVQPRVELAGSDIVFVGFGIHAPEKGWNDYAGLDVRGKTVVILVNDPDYAMEGLDGPFNGRAMTYYGRWTYKFEEAARQGAAAALIVHDDFPAAYGWNVVESSWTGPQFFPATADNGASQTLANGCITKPAAERLFAAAGKDFAALAAAARNAGFKPVALDGLKASVAIDNVIERTVSRNVVGILPGRERPGEHVLYTAHWDHLGRCTPAPDGDDICNGAIDNATGTAALVALAEAHVKAGPPARSLVFLAVTAEESGLLGSTYYAANPLYPLATTVGGVNMDALSMAGPARDVTVVGGGKSELDGYLAAALAQAGRVATPELTPERGYYYRSDHFPFARRGVPMLYVDGGEDLVEGGRAAGAAANQAYTDQRYHGPKDEFDPNWNWDGVMQDLQLYYRLGRMLAETDDWPNWVEGDEFRAVRDETAALRKAGEPAPK